MKRITERRLLMLTVAGIAASQLGATDCGQVIRDPGFDVWCGESLCSWKLVRGDIARVGTWHEGDSGVSFDGTDTAIQQVSPVNSTDGVCIRFSLVSDVADTAEVFLDIDVEADGNVEQRERIPTSNWQPVSFLIHVAPPYDGIRFELNKRGSGRAVLANVGAEISDECTGLPQIEIEPRPNGASCNDFVECGSGLCVQSPITAPPASVFGDVCADCDPMLGPTACAGGEVCGIGPALSPVLAVPLTCIPPASRELAEQCLTDAECASGKCAIGATGPGVCSSCKTVDDCGGQACGPSWLAGSRGPNVCRPGQSANLTGVACGGDLDCASGACAGSDRKVCNDGRPCSTDANCPANTDLTPGACSSVGIQGGTCS